MTPRAFALLDKSERQALFCDVFQAAQTQILPAASELPQELTKIAKLAPPLFTILVDLTAIAVLPTLAR